MKTPPPSNKERKSQDQNSTMSTAWSGKTKHPQTNLQTNPFKNPVHIYIYIFQYNYSTPLYTAYCTYTPLGYLK